LIRRGFVYRVDRVFRDPSVSRPVLVMTSDARNLDPRSPTVVGIPLTTSLKGGVFRVRLRRGIGGVLETSEIACEQIVQVPKRNFVADARGIVRPLGRPVDETLLDSVINAVVNVLSASAS
jgi:mRNA-degrading endonuclease toxin of MazEF toxin-antitoxin module